MVCRTAINQADRQKVSPAGENVLVLQEKKADRSVYDADPERVVELKFDDPPPKGGRPG